MYANGKRVYIAAPWNLKKDAAQLRSLLAVAGIHSTSRWIDVEEHATPEKLSAEYAAGVTRFSGFADMDKTDIQSAHALVLINPAAYVNKGTGGRHYETGYAVALNRPIFIFGVRSNVFHSDSSVRAVTEDLHELIRELNAMVML